MNNTILYLSMLLVVLLWSFTPFLRKVLLKKLSSFDFYIATQMIVMLYLFIMQKVLISDKLDMAKKILVASSFFIFKLFLLK